MKTIKNIALAVSSLFILPTLAHGETYKPAQTGAAMMQLQNTPFSKNPIATFLSGGSVWDNLRKNFRMQEVNSGLVRSHESKFAQNSAYFNRTIQRSTPYMYYITDEVKKRNMPAEVALLPFIESAYVTKARSHVGASGLWQFMPATGRHYGLEQTPLYDGRHDVHAATNAALDYLQYLYGLFGDWSLALAAYNWGEGNVTRAVNRAIAQGLPPTYENLKMPAETRNYVPKLLAVRNLVNNPSAFGLKLPEIKSEPYFKTVTVKAPLDIRAAAFLANIPESEFLALNPAFKTPVFIPKGNSRQMLLPVQAAKTFESNYKNSDLNTLLSWDVYTPSSRISLQDIAAQTGSSISEIQRLNGIRSTYLEAGRTILVSKNRASGIKPASEFAKADVDPMPDTFKEQAPVLGKGATNMATSAPTTASFPAPTPVVLATPHPDAFKQPEKPAIVVTQSSIRQPEKATATTTVVAQDNKQPEKTSIPTTPVVVFKPHAQPEKATSVAQSSKQPETPVIVVTQNSVKQPENAIVASAPTQPETPASASDVAHAVASNEKQPETVHHADNAAEDELMQLARASQERIRAAGLQTAPYQAVRVADDLGDASAEFLPGILKTATLGYDGKGQIRVNTIDEAKAAFVELGGVACVLEKTVDLRGEISVVVCRLNADNVQTYDPAENIHENGILAYSIVPARLNADICAQARQMAVRLAHELDYVGVLAVEMFVVGDAHELVVNEIAPRPHNSGHHTIDACAASQFQQQVRLMCGLPPADTKLFGACCMANILGDVWGADGSEPNWQPLQSDPRAHLHLYGKKAARKGRKMGHFTVLADDAATALDKAQKLHGLL